MEALKATSVLPLLQRTQFPKPISLNFPIKLQSSRKLLKFQPLNTSSSPTIESVESSDPELENENFDWFSQWYPVMPVCDLDKRAPHAKRVLGLDLVVWWDRNESEWKVFDDSCPHRLAPLSEGRIDQWGRLQCVYHGWCFNGSGDCKIIPQAPPDGPQVNTFKKACAAVYPSVVQNGIVWFWPRTEPEYKDILATKRPPYIPELDDPSFTKPLMNRDIPYGYEVLIENLMDPAHVPYAHYGIMRIPQPKNSVKVDREGGRPIEMRIQSLDKNGFIGGRPEMTSNRFIAPCVYYSSTNLGMNQSSGEQSTGVGQKRVLLVFICIPVSPGHSRLILTFPRNFGIWIDRVIPRWMFHIGQNLVLDSDLYLLHVEERKIMDVGPSNWLKACFVPTTSDAYVIGFRKWLNKYSGGQIDWSGKFSGSLPPSPPKEQLMDRYRSHVVNCSSCSAAHKGLKALEVVLQVASFALIGFVAVAKQGLISPPVRPTLVAIAVLCFAASRWLSHFIYKIFHFHDYNHALR